ncbi:MAG: TonB-dependent receptor, partial [Chitinophagaceae bacterium]|nr:TonB-dependent receptor [Chitinophagaceae bacterium]
RFGTLAQTDSLGTFYTYRTNIGNSVTRGLEIFVQADWQLGANSSISVFTSTALMHARYTDAIVKSGGLNQNISGNQVESAPDLTSRNGMTLRSGRLNLSALYSYTAATFADALNTVNPSPGTGAVGLVPAYGLLDLNAGFRFSRHVECRFNLSNLLDRQYFTKRPMFYPGPGVWSSDGRNFTASLAVRI